MSLLHLRQFVFIWCHNFPDWMTCLEKIMAMLMLCLLEKPCVRSLESSLCIWSQAGHLDFSEFSTSSLFPPPFFFFFLFLQFFFSSHLPSFLFFSNCLMCKHVNDCRIQERVSQQADFFLHVFDFCLVAVCALQANSPRVGRWVFCVLVLLYPKRCTQFASSYLQAQLVMHREVNTWFFTPVTFRFTPEPLLEGTESLHWEQLAP